jgi:hypothetical protein
MEPIFETYTGQNATELGSLKYIIDTTTTHDENDDIADIATLKLTKLNEFRPISPNSARKVVEYAQSVIASLVPITLRLRSRVQEMPDAFGKRTNDVMHAYRAEDVVGGRGGTTSR